MVTLLPADRRTLSCPSTVEPTTATSLPATMLTALPLSEEPTARLSCHASWVVVFSLEKVLFLRVC